MSLIHKTVKALRETAKANGLSGYSRMVKADLVELIASNAPAHKVGDVVRNVYNGRVGTVSYTNDAALIATTEDGGVPLSGPHHMFKFTGVRVEKPFVNPFDYPAVNDSVVTEAHVKFCAEHGHATHRIDDLISPNCARCGEPFVIMHPTREGHGYVTLGNGNIMCVAKHMLIADANHCAFDAAWKITVQANETIAKLDALDHNHVVEVMSQVVNNGRDDLTYLFDSIDAAPFQDPTGEDSTIPCEANCERCKGDVSRCDRCVLAWLVKLYNITGDVKLNELPHVAEFDCYA